MGRVAVGKPTPCLLLPSSGPWRRNPAWDLCEVPRAEHDWGGVGTCSQVIRVLRSFYLQTNRMEGTPEQGCPLLLPSESPREEPAGLSPALPHRAGSWERAARRPQTASSGEASSRRSPGGTLLCRLESVTELSGVSLENMGGDLCRVVMSASHDASRREQLGRCSSLGVGEGGGRAAIRRALPRPRPASVSLKLQSHLLKRNEAPGGGGDVLPGPPAHGLAWSLRAHWVEFAVNPAF